MVVTDRDEDSDAKVGRKIGKSLESISIRAGEWISNDIPEEKELIQEVKKFIESLKNGLVKELEQTNKYDKAAVGTFFSVRNSQNALRSFGVFLHKVDWTKSEYLKDLFLPFMYLGTEKPIKEKE